MNHPNLKPTTPAPNQPPETHWSGGDVFAGSLDATNMRFAVVASRWNAPVVEPLISGAFDALVRFGASPGKIDLVRVPGAFELPLAAYRVAAGGRFDAVICLGAVIRGDTPHFDFVATEAAHGIGQAACETGIPIAFGVLTTDTIEQALARAGGAHGNKGEEAAAVAVEMAQLLSRLPGRDK